MLVLLLIVVLTICIIFKKYKKWSDKSVPQSRFGFIFDDSLSVVLQQKSLADLVLDLYNLYPKSRCMGFYFLNQPVLLIKDPDLIKQIAVKDFDHFVNHQSIFSEDYPFLTRNIFFQKDETWKEMRTAITPLFSTNKIKYMFDLMLKNGQNFIDCLSKKNQNLIILEMRDVFNRIANDFIVKLAFGVDCDSLNNPKNEFYKMTEKLLEVDKKWKRYIRFMGYLIAPKLYKILKVSPFEGNAMTFFLNLVKTNIDTQLVRPDMINILLAAQKTNLEDKKCEITSQAVAFLFAGYNSVSSLLSFMAYELAMNPDIQTKLIQEVDATKISCNGQISYEAITQMKYMDMVVNETLRKWPPSLLTTRVCTNDYTIQPKHPNEKKVHLEKNSVVWFPTFGLQRDQKYFSEPDKFNPERFNDENRKKIKTCTFMVFGYGPRNCIGSRLAILETKTLFFQILSKFEFLTVERTPEVAKFQKKIKPGLEGGFWVGLKKREE